MFLVTANQYDHLYNGCGQALDTFQSHSGAVNLSTTPSVQMAYADGSANTIRPTRITYPDGRQVTFDYGAADSIHDQCSLVASLIDSDTGETHLADYQYLGLGTVVLQDSPQADLRYTLVSLTGSNDPDTGDIYSGLDRFGRVKDLRWRNTDTGSDLSRVLYGYDRASSRIWRENPSDSSRRYDWLYGYDGLHRLHSAERGELNSGHTSITTPQFGQCWTLDPTGNWQGFRQDDDGNSTWDLIQARTSNPVNEITDIDNTTGPSWVTPTYDANGSMTTIPRPDLGVDKAMTATWDAWNRLVKLVDPSTSDTLAEFAYDGRNFRIVGKAFDGGTLDETRHYYFTDSWQCLEERIDSSSDPERQHVWGIRYIDDLVLRDRDTTGNGTLDERLYFLPDANWNVTAVVDESGAVQERIEYTPYGWRQFLSPTFGTRTGSSFDVRYTYTSREWEGAAGLYYFRNRWYAPTLGVFCSRDPIGFWGSPWHLYEYVAAESLSNVDPFGLYGPMPGADEYWINRSPGEACRTLASLIKTFLPTAREREYFDHFTAGKGTTKIISRSEVMSYLTLDPNWRDQRKAAQQACVEGKTPLSTSYSHEFGGVLGWARVTPSFNCDGCRLCWSVKIEDTYDFNWSNHRKLRLEAQVRLVWLAQRLCSTSWKDFRVFGSAAGGCS